MHAAFVLVIALTGLGCENKDENVMTEAPPVFSGLDNDAANAYPRYTAPSSYSGYYERSYNNDISDVYPSHWDAFHATLYSFVVGRDPGIATAKEIEASVYGDYPAH